MKLVLIIALSLLFFSGQAQEIKWSSTRDWKLYNLKGHGVFNYSVDTLINFKSYTLNQDSIIALIKNVTVISVEKQPIWMGAYVGSFEYEGQKVKIEISYYGGFFYSEKDRKYYELSKELAKEWSDYFSNCFKNFSQKN
jgi:hypothetical protein